MTNSAQNTGSSPDPLPALLLLNVEKIDAAVEAEYAENDRRLNWFLLFQAFLFQGYATALQSITGASAGHETEIAHAILLMVLIITVALITGGLTHVSTQAGIVAVERLKQLREGHRQEAEAHRIFTGGWFPKSDPHRLHDKGLLPTRWAPRLIIVAWIAVALHCAWTFTS